MAARGRAGRGGAGRGGVGAVVHGAPVRRGTAAQPRLSRRFAGRRDRVREEQPRALSRHRHHAPAPHPRAPRPGSSPAGTVPAPVPRPGSSAAPESCAVLAVPVIGKRQWKETCQEIVNRPPAAILLGMQNLLFKAEVVEASPQWITHSPDPARPDSRDGCNTTVPNQKVALECHGQLLSRKAPSLVKLSYKSHSQQLLNGSQGAGYPFC
ncbi:uncharacterized protein ACIQIH_013899 [Cyanocitta cristata]